MYTRMIEKDSQSKALSKVGWQAFMSIITELWQAHLIALVSAFLAIKVGFAEEKHDQI